MATADVLLVKPVEGLGNEGDEIKVRAGYARNYLLPQKIAIPVTRANKRQIEALQKARALREQRELEGAQALAAKIEALHIAIAVKTGEGGRMFGAVTAADLLEKVVEAGIEVDKKKVHLYTPIKELGQHSTTVKLHPEVSVELTFDVVSENPIVEAEDEDDSDED
jgi:large subunit ribosomal protein L9